ncbi:MAG: hypothetical protein ACQERS_10410 [Bacteroidota bacterium]
MKTKRERFESIASSRVQKVINNLNSLAKCSNKNNYDYTEEDVNKMMSAIKKNVKDLENKFKSSLANKDQKFKF